MDSMFNTPQEVVQANMNGAVKKAATSKRKYSLWESWWCLHRTRCSVQ